MLGARELALGITRSLRLRTEWIAVQGGDLRVASAR